MKKGILLLSALLLVGVSACDFFGKKKEETKAVEEKPAAAQAMGDVVGQEVAVNNEANPPAGEYPSAPAAEEPKKEEQQAPAAEQAPAPAAEVPAEQVK